MVVPKSKRFRFTAVAIGINFLTVWVGMYFSVDLVSLGKCLSLINAPLYFYVLGDTLRSSNMEDINK
jgi:hypothetical protein